MVKPPSVAVKSWDGSIPHRIENHGARPAKLLVARTPPGFLNATVYEAQVETVAARGAPAGRRRARKVSD